MKINNKDCNEKMISEIGKLAIEGAIMGYRNGYLALDVFEQLGEALFYLQKQAREQSRKPKAKKRVRK